MVPGRELVIPLRCERLEVISWAEHGFGTRLDGVWIEPESSAKLRQVHGAEVVSAKTAGHHGDGDALITATPGLWLEIRTADCVPLLLVDPVKRVVAAIHAGWRGSAAGISRSTVEILRRNWDSNPENLQVAIGPCIGACCFQVGDNVAAEFPGHTSQSPSGFHVDLVSVNRSQLTRAGILDTHIHVMGLCTACDPLQFHSFRREGGDGRMIAAIRIRPGK